jgi:hypothetical protein
VRELCSSNLGVLGAFLGVASFPAYVGVPLAQVIVGGTREIVARVSAVQDIRGGANRWPQRFVGTVETLVYTLAFAYFPPKRSLLASARFIRVTAPPTVPTEQVGTGFGRRRDPGNRD